MTNNSKNIVIIGAGPGGYVAAIRASQLGANVTLIEKSFLGGTCTNLGCIPTKSMLNSVGTILKTRKAQELGIEISNNKIDFSLFMKKKDSVVEKLRKGINFLLKRNGVNLIYGKGELLSENVIKVVTENGEEKIEADNIILATGSSPLKLRIFDFKQPTILTSDDLMVLKETPESMIIVGGGVVGCEIAMIFHILGTEVTVVEMLPHLLPLQDPRLSRYIERSFKKEGIKYLTNSRVEGVKEYGDDYAILSLATGDEVKAQRVAVCIGRVPNSKDLGLENLNIDMERGFVKVNEKMETNIPGIYAIGDLVGGKMLAHVASAHGEIVAENIMGREAIFDDSMIPITIYTHPQVSSVGLTPDQAKEKKHEISLGNFPFSAVGKANAIEESEGFIQIVADKNTGEILGAQMVGPEVSELIHLVAFAMQRELLISDLSEMIASHPTLSEAVREAALSCLGRPIHTIKL